MDERFALTPAVKNLLIINVLCFAASYVLNANMGIDIDNILGLHYYQASNFGIWQFVTFLFLHGGISHVFFNMFAVYMFGRIIEQVWGTRKFLIYYFVVGIGSGLIQQVALYYDMMPFVDGLEACIADPTVERINDFFAGAGVPFSQNAQMAYMHFAEEYNAVFRTDAAEARSLAIAFFDKYQQMYVDQHITIGASGAVFGLLLAFGMLFPNMRLMLLFPPIPIKAKYFVIGYGLIELFEGIHNSPVDNVAHWAHLGGMLFGFILIRRWKERTLY